jgi:hypothetical protein
LFEGLKLSADDAPPEQTPETDRRDRETSGRPEPQSPTAWVERTLENALQIDRLERDDAGDFLFRFGSSLSFVRVFEEEPPRIEIFAPIVRDLERTPALLEGLNEIHLQLRFARALLTPAGQVVLAAESLARTLNERELLFILNLVLRAADEFDTKIRQRFGGRKMFEEEGESVDV